MKNWKKIKGPVKVKSFNRAEMIYPNIEAAVVALGERNIQNISDNRLNSMSDNVFYLERSEYEKTFNYALYRFYYGAQNFAFYDEHGIRIPAWKIIETFYNLPRKDRTRKSRFRSDNFDFRNGPVPGTSKRNWRGHYYRHIRTYAEIRDNEAISADLLELEENYNIRYRKNIPDAWDDILHARKGDNWKNYRKTQYKPH